MLKRMDEDNVLCVLTEPDCDGLMVLTDGIDADVFVFVMVRAATSVSVVESGRPSRAKPSTFDLRPSTFDLLTRSLARSFARHTS